MLYNAVQLAITPPKVPLSLEASALYLYVVVPWTHQTQHRKLHLDRFSCLCTAHGREFQHFTMSRHFPSPSKVPLSWGSGPHLTRGSLSLHQSQHPERHHKRFSLFCRVYGRDRLADRPTDR